MGLYDWIVGELRCPACGNVSRDVSTNMQTKLAKRPYLREFSIGDSIDADWSDVCSARYLKVAEPKQLDTISILETWDCPNCSNGYNWARISIRGGKIERVEAVELSVEVVRTANYISEDCSLYVDASVSWETMVDRFVERLGSATKGQQYNSSG